MKKGQFDLRRRGQRVVAVMNESMAAQLIDVLEETVLDGLELTPELYKLGESLNKMFFPDRYFGEVKKAA